MLFEREDSSATIKGKTHPIVSYKLVDVYYQFLVLATAEGVRLNGFTPTLSSQDEVDELFRIVEWCHRHHVSIQETGSTISQETLDAEILE